MVEILSFNLLTLYLRLVLQLSACSTTNYIQIYLGISFQSFYPFVKGNNDKTAIMKKIVTLTFLWILFLSFHYAADAQYHMLGSYEADGRPKYLVIPADTVGSTFRTNISANLPESRSLPIYNPRFLATGRPETLELTSASDVWVTFVDEGASYQNVLGYYTFPSDAPLTTAPLPANINIIFPNASKSGYGGSLNPGDKVYLGKFPANTSIGFVLLANGWDWSSETVNCGKWSLYSESKFNPESDSALRKHTVMLYDTASGRIVIGFEDMRRDPGYGSDNDFNDVLFYTTVSPLSCVKHLDSIPNLNHDGHVSFSGETGGLESKSLGDALTNRIYQKARNNQLGEINYKKLPLLNSQQRLQTFGIGTGGLALSDLMPTQIPDSGIVGYVSTPTDITAITNAVDVQSVDFTYNNQCRAVAFATKTLSLLYSHTKPVCDRLKGAKLLGMENFMLSDLNFVRYTLQQPTGNIEYAMSFSIGKKTGRNNFSFQSNWLTNDYVGEDTLYNFQVWGAAPYYCIDMALEILNKLNGIMPVQQLKASTALPATYIISGNRDGVNLNLSVQNASNATSGYFLVEDRSNESSSVITTRSIPFTLTANSVSNITLPVNDVLESTISLFMNNTLEDVVFMSDGVWGADFNGGNSSSQKFTVTNDTIKINNNNSELHVLRNVQISAITSSYVSVYKLLKGGGSDQDLTGFKTLRLTASGANTNLRIYLIKSSITNFADQYYYVFPLTADQKDHTISLNDFKSAAFNNSIDLKDITQIVFAFEVTGGGSNINLNGTIGNVLFSKYDPAYYNGNISSEIQVYPNPSAGKFTANFNANSNAALVIQVIDPGTGKIILNKNVNAFTGPNSIPIEINQTGFHLYILSILGEGVNYQSKKIMVNKN